MRISNIQFQFIKDDDFVDCFFFQCHPPSATFACCYSSRRPSIYYIDLSKTSNAILMLLLLLLLLLLSTAVVALLNFIYFNFDSSRQLLFRRKRPPPWHQMRRVTFIILSRRCILFQTRFKHMTMALTAALPPSYFVFFIWIIFYGKALWSWKPIFK